MERLTIDGLIAHCDRQLNRLPSGNVMYQEHESVRAYLQILRHYVNTGTVEEFRALKEAEQKRQEGCSWCKQFAGVPLRGFTTHGCTKTTAKFCLECGRDLRGESHDDN